MKKRLIMILLALCAVFGLFTVSASAEEIASGTCGDNLTWVLTDDGTLTISGEGKMADYTYNTHPWVEYQEMIQAIVVEEGTSSIGASAFYGFHNLNSVSLPNGLLEIGQNAFSQDREEPADIDEIVIPDSVVYIGRSAFAGSGVRKINIPTGVSVLEERVFRGCWALENVHIPYGVTQIGEYAFSECYSLKEIFIPNSVTDIGQGAFPFTALNSIIIPSSITSIGPDAFYGCQYLETIYFIGNAPAISDDYGYAPFCDVTATAYYPAGNPTWTEETMGSYGGTLTWVTCEASGTCGENLTWVLTDDGALTISGEGEMYYSGYFSPWHEYCDQIISVVVEPGITTVYDKSFYDCKELISVTLPAELVSIGDNAFENCSSLQEIILPESLTSMGYGVFSYCDSLKNIIIPSGIDEIKFDTFLHCTSLERVSIPDSVTKIGSSVFSYCHNLTTVNIPHGVTTLAQGLFYECSSLTELNIPDSVNIIHENVFYGCTSLNYLHIPDGVTKIQENTFYGCTNLNLTIPNGVTEIGSKAFYQCASLTDVVIPALTTSIASGSFTGCTSLTEFKIEDGNTAYCVADGLLYDIDCQKLIAVPCGRSGIVVVPDGVKNIGVSFEDCVNLTEIVLPEGITSIDWGAFSGCSSLTTFTFPESADWIEQYVFGGCTSLKTIYFIGDAPEQALRVFGDIQGIDQEPLSQLSATAYYPANNETWTENTMLNCGGNITWVPYDPANPFTDVPEDSFYIDPVLWALEKGITTGATDTTFNPDGNCLRAQVVTFLWRAAGEPEPTTTVNPFSDVKETDFYYKAVLWAVENGITNGTSATTFSPMAECNRAAVVTFLYRAMGEPAVSSTNNPFTDVDVTAFYGPAVLWAVENGITNGMGDGTFGIGKTCNRAQVVTFLYRTYQSDEL